MPVFEPVIPDIKNAKECAEILQKELGITGITARLLVNRGITDASRARAFLYPSIQKLYDPFKLPDMKKATERLKLAIARKQLITIYGDYDVDGITSASLLYLFLRELGARVGVYIPHRLQEGYGVNKEAIKSIYQNGTELLITVDCGITSVEEVILANQLGMDVIVTDHHECGVMLPPALAVINPKRKDSVYPFSELAGVGVAAKLVQALGGIEAVEKYIDLIAVGTVADIVPLIEENRILVSRGLEKINTSPAPGIGALVRVSGLEEGSVDVWKIAFVLAPRINAAGRVANAHRSFYLLTSEDLESAIPVARELEQDNKVRQEIEQEIIAGARQKISKQIDLAREKIIVVEGEGWHPGVIGIVASKLTELYCRPSILLSVNGEEGVGSARSIKGFDIYEALSCCRDLFIKFGGHEQAAGFSILRENIPEFCRRISLYAREHIDDFMLVPRITYDTVLKSEDITYTLIKELELMAPFGTGNPYPSFLLNNVSVENYRSVGKEGKHLKVVLGMGQRSWDGIGFNLGHKKSQLSKRCKLSLVVDLCKNEWMGVTRVQFQIKAIKNLIEDQKDVEKLLQSFYFKFFDAFLSEVMHNKFNANIGKVSLDNVPILGVEELVAILQKTCTGHLIMVNTFEGSYRILNTLLGKGIIERIFVGFGRIDESEGVGANAVVIAPEIFEIPFQHYRNIYLLEDEIAMYPPVLNQFEKRINKIRLNEKIDTLNLRKNFEINRDILGKIYKWIRFHCLRQSVWPDFASMLESYNAAAGECINGFQLLLSLQIFQELDFIDVDEASQFVKINFFSNPRKRELHESSLYCYYDNWKNRCFYKIKIQGGVEG